MSNVGALVSAIQSIIWLGFCSHFLEVYLNKSKLKPNEQRNIPVDNEGRVVLHHLTKDTTTLIVAMLFFACIFHLVWMGSSLLLMVRNKHDSPKVVSQYLIVSFFIGIMDIIFSFMILGTTFSVFGVATQGTTASSPYQEGDETFTVQMTQDHFGTYFWLLMTFIRGGCFTFGINIFFTWIAYKRFMELRLLETVLRRNRGSKELDVLKKPQLDPIPPTTCVDVPRPYFPPSEADLEAGDTLQVRNNRKISDKSENEKNVEEALNEVYEPSGDED